MKRLKKAAWFLYQVLAAYTILIYCLILWIPFHNWLAGFMMMSFPIVIIAHIAGLLFWLVTDRKKAIFSLVLLLAGGMFLSRTYRIKDQSATNESASADTFSVISYNVHVFLRDADHRQRWVRKDIRDAQEWLKNSGADILALPEYYDDVTTLFQAKELLRAGGYKYQRFYHTRKAKDVKYWGLALFSKYPIIASRDTVFIAQNGMIQADIKIRKDTVRVIGLHLFSMTLNLGLLKEQRDMDGAKHEGSKVFRQMKTGFVRHASEANALKSWIETSPYPVIVCGDFNETPYGYVYGTMRKLLANGFEEKGEGFGFTYNHIPNFIRIDHHFFSSDKLEITDFKTYNKIPYSDHYPVGGTYRFR